MGTGQGVVLAVCCLVALGKSFYPSLSHAAIIDYIDIDGTFFHDSGRDDHGKKPAFLTPWVLTRVQTTDNGFGLEEFAKLVATGKLPDRVLITRDEFDHVLEGKLAQGEGQTGDLTPVELPHISEYSNGKYDGKRPPIIIPGYYFVDPHIAYRYHRDVEPGENVILDSFHAAVRRAKESKEFAWKGRAFPYLQRAIDEAHFIFLLSDRDSRQTSIDELFAEMHRLKEIGDPFVRGPDGKVHSPQLISMTDSRSRIYGTKHELHERKAARIESDAAKLARSSLKKHLTLGADINLAISGIHQLMHEVRIYENDPDKIAGLLRRAKILATMYPDLKFILFHAGELEAVEGADFNRGQKNPSRWVVFTPTGTGWRHPLPEELAEFEGHKRSQGCGPALGDIGDNKK